MTERFACTMSEQLTERLRERILSGAYTPGAQLLQDSIAAEFGVSKNPVREALAQLRSEGLVDIFTHRGFQVRPVSLAEAEEMFRLRLAIEPAAVAEGSRRAQAEDHQTCKQALTALDKSFAGRELKFSADLNAAFHLALVVPRLQPATHEMLYRLHTVLQRYMRLHLSPDGRVKRAIKEHDALYDAWVARKAKEAQRLTQQHIEQIQAEVEEALRRAM